MCADFTLFSTRKVLQELYFFLDRCVCIGVQHGWKCELGTGTKHSEVKQRVEAQGCGG